MESLIDSLPDTEGGTEDISKPEADSFNWDASAQDLIGGKYKTAGDLAEGYNQQKNYITELRGAVKDFESKSNVPEEYAFDFESGDLKEFKGNYESSKDDFDSFFKVFKTAGLNQEQAGAVLKGYLDTTKTNVPTVEEEIAKLGPNSTDILSGVKRFASGLSKEDQDVFGGLTSSAAGVDFLSRHLIKRPESIPTKVNSVPSKSAGEWAQAAREYKQKNIDIIGADKSMQKEYMNLMSKVFEAEESEKQ